MKALTEGRVIFTLEKARTKGGFTEVCVIRKTGRNVLGALQIQRTAKKRSVYGCTHAGCKN